jgi:hypothetical protein
VLPHDVTVPVVFSCPEPYLTQRRALSFNRVDYGVGGMELLEPADLEQGQVG